MKRLLILILISIAIRILLPIDFPLDNDEALYAQILSEMIQHPSIYTNYMGEYVPWKPPLMFYVYSGIAKLLMPFGIQTEVLYRLPNLIFAVLTTVAFYFLTKNLTKDEDLSFIAALVLTSAPMFMVTNTLLMTDNLLLFFVVSSLAVYTLKETERQPALFLIGGALAFLAFFTKSLASFIILPLIIADYFINNKKTLKNGYFLTSLLLPFLAVLVLSSVFGEAWLRQYFIDAGRITLGTSKGVTGTFEFILENLAVYAALLLPWLSFGLSTLIVKKKRDQIDLKLGLFLMFWLIFFIPPLIIPSALFWYALPVLPAFAIFVAYEAKSEKFDWLSKLFLAVLIILSVAFSYMMANEFAKDLRIQQKDAGMYLSGKDGVAVIGRYSPGLLYYKFNNEDLPYNRTLILFLANSGDTRIDNQTMIELRSFVSNGRPIDKTLVGNYLIALYGPALASPINVQGDMDMWIKYVVLDAAVSNLREIFSQEIDQGRLKLIYNNKRYYIYEKVAG